MLKSTKDQPLSAHSLLTSVLLSLSSGALAQVSDPRVSGSVEWVDDIRDQVRQSTSSLAQELDEFLSDREYESERNESRLALRFRSVISSNNEPEFRVDPQVRLRLPNTERLIFIDVLGGARRTVEEEASAGLVDPSSANEEGGVVQLRGVREVGGLRISPSVGLRFESGEPKAFAGVRISAAKVLASGISVFGSQRLIADSGSVIEAITVLRSDWQTGKSTVLRGQLLLDWSSDRDSFRYEPAVIFRWLANERTVLSFENYFEVYSSPDEIPEKFVSGLRLRRRLYEDWLFGEFRPWVSFEYGTASSRTSGAELIVEVNF